MLERFAVSLPDGLHNTNVGHIAADSLPLVTMLCCLPTMSLFWRHRRVLDLVVLIVGFFLACVYHICHMAPEGLVASRVLGISGPAWRSLDVVYAQWLLGRTFGHAVGASHSISKGVMNGAFPALLLHHVLTGSPLSVAVCGRALLCTLAAVLVTKVILEGAKTMPDYPTVRGCSTAALFLAGFIAFPMPELFPRHYWLFHSLWHAFLGAGYFELYAILEGESWKGTAPARLRREDSFVQLSERSAIEDKQTAAALQGDSCSAKASGRAEAAHILASGSVSGHLSKRGLGYGDTPEARGIERVGSGSVPWPRAERLRLYRRSLQRLARLVCLHS